jgi:pimeloyl-ACP methyl ester carboxylesterase
MNHVEFDWQSPVWSPLLTQLAAQFRLIRYDERGTGLSDWNVADLSFETFVRDLETVADALDLRRFALFGNAQGAAVAIAYAVRHPDRVSRLVLSGGYAQGWRARGNPAKIEWRKALLKLVRVGWGQDNPAFRQVFTSLMIPGGTLEQSQWVNDLQRVSTSPANAARLLQVFGDIDVAHLLSRVAAPTLVLHSRGDAPCPFEQGLMLARGIPNARFVALESRNNVILSHEPAWQRFVDEVCAFLDENGGSISA